MYPYELYQELVQQGLEPVATAYTSEFHQESVRRRATPIIVSSSRLFARGGRRHQGRVLVRTPNVVYHYRYNGLGVRGGKVRSYTLPVRGGVGQSCGAMEAGVR